MVGTLLSSAREKEGKGLPGEVNQRHIAGDFHLFDDLMVQSFCEKHCRSSRTENGRINIYLLRLSNWIKALRVSVLFKSYFVDNCMSEEARFLQRKVIEATFVICN